MLRSMLASVFKYIHVIVAAVSTAYTSVTHFGSTSVLMNTLKITVFKYAPKYPPFTPNSCTAHSRNPPQLALSSQVPRPHRQSSGQGPKLPMLDSGFELTVWVHMGNSAIITSSTANIHLLARFCTRQARGLLGVGRYT